LQVASSFYVGSGSNATLTIANGGTVVASDGISLASSADVYGALAINTNGTLEVGGSSGISIGSGIGNVSLDGGIIQVIGNDLTTNVAMTLYNCNALPNIIDTNGYNATLSGVLSGSGSLEKISDGNLTLAASETYTGDTNVLRGGLVVEGRSGGNIGNATQSSGDLYVGGNTASLLIDNDASVYAGEVSFGNNQYDSDNITVTDSGSVLNASESLTVAADGSANLTIANGALVTANTGVIALNATANGTVLVTGANSNLTVTNNLTVGGSGNGSLSITDGGSVSIQGLDANGVGTDVAETLNSLGSLLVDGAGSFYYGSHPLVIGHSGSGLMTVSGGGAVEVQNADSNNIALYLGRNITGSGNLYVTGANSTVTLDNGNLQVGQSGAGNATVDNGGSVDIMDGSVVLGNESGSSGTFDLNDNGTLSVGGTNGIASGEGDYFFNFNGGTLVASSDLTSSVNFSLGDGTTSTIDTNGYNATVNGGVTGNTGGLDVNGGGTLVLNGNNTYTGTTSVTSGNLVINGQQASPVTVTGPGATLGGNGTINNDVTLISAGLVVPGINNTVNYSATGNGTSGTASGLAGLTISGNLSWSVSNSTLVWHLSSSSLNPLASDTLTVLGNLTNTGSTTATLTFDFGNTGYYDGVNHPTYTLITSSNDLSQQFSLSQFAATNVWQDRAAEVESYFIFADGGTELQFVIVPEPAMWGLLLGGATLLVGLRRKRRKQ